MTIDAYYNPEFIGYKMGIFFLVTLVGVVACVLLILGISKLVNRVYDYDEDEGDNNHVKNFVQLFYEMMISGASGITFASSYVVANHLFKLIEENGTGGFEVFYAIWSDYKDFALLFLICMSCVINSALDRLIIPLKLLKKEKKATVRMLGMFYVIVVLIFLDTMGDKSEYGPVMIYYLGLMVGRFVYFDASLTDFLEAMRNVIKNLPLMLMGLMLMGGLCYFGFSMGYFLEKNYYIMGVLYTHIFIVAAIFLLHIADLIRGAATARQ